MKIINGFFKLVDMSSKLGVYIASITIFIMMISTVTDSFSRRFLGYAFAGVIELNEILLVVSIFLAVAWTQKVDEHISVELVYLKLSRKTQLILTVITSLFASIIIGFLTYETFLGAWDAFVTKDFRDGAVKYLLWPGKMFVPIGGVLLLAELVREIIQGLVSLLPIKGSNGG